MSVFRISETIKAAADLGGVCLRLFTPTCQLVGRSLSDLWRKRRGGGGYATMLLRHPRYEFSASSRNPRVLCQIQMSLSDTRGIQYVTSDQPGKTYKPCFACVQDFILDMQKNEAAVKLNQI